MTRATMTGVLAGVGAAASAGIAGAETLILVAGVPRTRGTPTGIGVLLVAGLVLVVCARMWRRRARADDGGDDGSPASVTELRAEHGDRAALDATLTALGEAFEEAASTSAVPLAVHVGDEVVEVFWDRPPPPASKGFRAAPTGWVWTATGSQLAQYVHDPAEPRELGPPVLPGLVALGATGLGELFINLEGCRLVNLVGDAGEVRDALECLDASLAHASGDVMIVSRDPLGSSSGVVGLDEALVEARRRRATARRYLDERHLTSLYHARATEATACPPLLVVVADPSGCDPETLGRLARVARGERSGVACVFANHVPDGEHTTMRCRGGALEIPFLEGVVAVLPEPEDRHAGWRPEPVAPLAVVAGSGDEIPSPTAVSVPANDHASDGDAGGDGVDPTADPCAPGAPEESGSVEVRVLGPVEVIGATSVLGGKSVELIAYLVCHRDGVSDERVKSVLWPARPVTHQTWLNRLSACRHAMGADADGELLLPHLEEGICRLASGVSSDVERLDGALARAQEDPEHAVEWLRAGLGLVRGRPFHERSGYEWAFAELHAAHAERLVTDAALQLAELALAAGDARLALWATEQGLLAVPGSEPLACARMRAFAADGDLRGVHRALRDLLAEVGGADPEHAERALHPDTLELYHRLCAPQHAPGGWPPAAAAR